LAEAEAPSSVYNNNNNNNNSSIFIIINNTVNTVHTNPSKGRSAAGTESWLPPVTEVLKQHGALNNAMLASLSPM
jgi:hypothetical protein